MEQESAKALINVERLKAALEFVNKQIANRNEEMGKSTGTTQRLHKCSAGELHHRKLCHGPIHKIGNTFVES